PAGASTPLRMITGPLTGLDSCASSGCHTMALTYSKSAGQLYVAVNQATGSHVRVFAGGAAGNTAPSRSIEGPNTGLSGRVVTGIAVSQLTGELYALNKPSQFGGPMQISVFGSAAQGNVAPLRIITDASSPMNDALGIGLVSSTVLGVAPTAAPRLVVEPNPAHGPTSVRLSLAQPLESLRLDVMDPQGRIVAHLWNGGAPAGTLNVRWDVSAESRAVRSGIYWVRGISPGFQIRQRVAVIR